METRSEPGVGADSSQLITQSVQGVPLAYWNPVRKGRAVDNFGDVMSPQLVSRMLGGTVAAAHGVSAHQATLVGQGSIAHLVPSRAVLWGTGVNGKMLRPSLAMVKDIDVRAVRGPWTRRVLEAQGIPVPAIYGDPGSLVGRLYPELRLIQNVPSIDALCAPNLNDMAVLEMEASAQGMAVLDPQIPVQMALEIIASAKFVVGSSLHAVIVAESLGIPARFVVSSAESLFKYLDYLAGTRRPYEWIATSLEAAVQAGGMEPPIGDLDQLMEAFPRDLWNGGGGRPHTPPAPAEDPAMASWFASWAAPQNDSVTRLQEYKQALDDLLATNSTDREMAIDRVVECRRWHAPILDGDTLTDPIHRSLDMAVTRSDWNGLRRILAQQSAGFTAAIYDVFTRHAGTVVAVTVQTPVPADPIRSVRLPNTDGSRLTISTSGLAIGPTQTRLDLDAFAAGPFDPDLNRAAGVLIELESGVTVQVPLELLNEARRFE